MESEQTVSNNSLVLQRRKEICSPAFVDIVRKISFSLVFGIYCLEKYFTSCFLQKFLLSV